MTRSPLTGAGRARVETLAAQMLERERWPRERLLEFQRPRLREIVRHAAANSPTTAGSSVMWATATSTCSGFLEALEAMGEQDPEVLDSWYSVLRPGLDYMKQVCGQKRPPKPVRARRSSSKAVGATPPTQPLPHVAADGAKAHG